MRKTAVTIVVVCVAAVSLAGAGLQQGQPFDRLWNALTQLTSRVAALESATPPAGPGAPVVVNGSGAAIGFLLGTSNVLHYDGARWLSIGPLAQGGFGSNLVAFQFDQQNCAGGRYLTVSPANDTPLVRGVSVQNGVGYYAGEPFAQVTIRSRLFSNGTCNATPPPETAWVGPVAQLDLAALGSGPFSVQ